QADAPLRFDHRVVTNDVLTGFKRDQLPLTIRLFEQVILDRRMRIRQRSVACADTNRFRSVHAEHGDILEIIMIKLMVLWRFVGAPYNEQRALACFSMKKAVIDTVMGPKQTDPYITLPPRLAKLRHDD